tara:strand:- start:1539 stop:1748 length:210 start_codon:yes stop_codon:yes gene_type:complete
MFKITAILCILSVNGQNLCLQGDLPLTMELTNEEQCVNTVSSIGMSVHEEFMKRQIVISMECKKIGEAV